MATQAPGWLQQMLMTGGGRANAPLTPAQQLKQYQLNAQNVMDETGSKVPFRPHPRYFEPRPQDKKLIAAENAPVDAVFSLAEATAEAVKKGHLSPEVAKLVLPNAMIENRWNDYGLNAENLNPKTRAYKDLVAPRQAAQAEYVRKMQAIDDSKPAGQLQIKALTDQYAELIDDNKLAAAQAVSHLVEMQGRAKARGRGDDPLAVIETWNGKGPEARRHAGRVSAAEALLEHPENAGIKKMFDQYYTEAMAK